MQTQERVDFAFDDKNPMPVSFQVYELQSTYAVFDSLLISIS